jgi:hypothetical protein
MCAYYIHCGLPCEFTEILSYPEMESASKNGKIVTNCQIKGKPRQNQAVPAWQVKLSL